MARPWSTCWCRRVCNQILVHWLGHMCLPGSTPAACLPLKMEWYQWRVPAAGGPEYSWQALSGAAKYSIAVVYHMNGVNCIIPPPISCQAQSRPSRRCSQGAALRLQVRTVHYWFITERYMAIMIHIEYISIRMNRCQYISIPVFVLSNFLGCLFFNTYQYQHIHTHTGPIHIHTCQYNLKSIQMQPRGTASQNSALLTAHLGPGWGPQELSQAHWQAGRRGGRRGHGRGSLICCKTPCSTWDSRRVAENLCNYWESNWWRW